MLPSDIPGAEEEKEEEEEREKGVSFSVHLRLSLSLSLSLSLQLPPSLFLIHLFPPFVLSFSLCSSPRRKRFIFTHLN